MSATPITLSPGQAWNLLFLAWLVAAVSTLAALFLGEVMGYTPCVLCWYQRICMFPLVLILAAGLFPFDRRVLRYALPLALAGLALALWHWGVAAGLIPEQVTPCSQGVPCSRELVSWFGFLTLPMLSALAFSSIIALLLLIHFKVPE
ncbi:MAG: disulfide bond formation protein B [Betaproteobacteria bacterium]|jgi:disulfide bond formation protein DsbB|nr:disulfide bond formation protein B [Betaproteobacteria bacterium]MCU0934148.1 disulfide bond formation protein B [Thiobacillaceae bacterium]